MPETREYEVKKSVIAAIAMACAPVFASCVGSGSFQTCMDANGNSYNVQRYGNSTYMQGSNLNTGNTWTQNSQTYGNTTYHNGVAANGNAWNGTSSTYGGTTFHQGIDSNGNAYSKICNQFGCN